MAGMAGRLALGVAPSRAKALCVFIHGRAPSPKAMQAVIRPLTAPDVACVLPRAEGASWYSSRAIDPLTEMARGELARSIADVAAMVVALQGAAPGVPLVLAGVSQGACLALELAFSGTVAVQALVALTGCRVGSDASDRPAGLSVGLPVWLTAGQDDPWIPLPAFAQAVVAPGQAGAQVRAEIFPARPHEISTAEIALLDGILGGLAAGAVVRA